MFVQKAGDFQPTLNNLALPAMQALTLLLLVATTTMARSAVPGTGTGGRLHRTMRRIATTCTGMVLAWVPAATLATAGSTCVVFAPPNIATTTTLFTLLAV